MFNGIKRLGKIQFKEDNFFLGSLTLMYIFEGPSQAIMDGSAMQEALLIFMHQLKNNALETISQNLSDHLQTTVKESDGPEVVDVVRRVVFLEST